MTPRSLSSAPILAALVLTLAACTMPRPPPADDAPTPPVGVVTVPPPVVEAPPVAVDVPPAPSAPPPRAEAAVQSPVPLRRPAPAYPPALTRDGVEGVVIARFAIDARGVPETVRIVRTPHPLFDRAVVEAVRRWRYEPARDAQGRAVRYEVQVPFRFRLQD